MTSAMEAASSQYSGYIQVIITAEDESLVVKFGDSTVVADDTLTSKAYAEGNFYVLAGTVQEVLIPKGFTHASHKAAGVGSIKISVGYEVGYLQSCRSSADIDRETKVILRNMVHWMIGSKKGDWDPGRSLYIFGGLGVGKSTIAEAAHFVYAFYKHKTGWTNRYLSFADMESIFIESFGSEQMDAIARLSCGGWILDDIKPEMYLVNYFGNEIQLINRILHARHNLWRRTGQQTIITSNTSWKAFIHADHLNDKRLADRIKQQFIPIEYNGTNKRSPATRLKHS